MLIRVFELIKKNQISFLILVVIVLFWINYSPYSIEESEQIFFLGPTFILFYWYVFLQNDVLILSKRITAIILLSIFLSVYVSAVLHYPLRSQLGDFLGPIIHSGESEQSGLVPTATLKLNADGTVTEDKSLSTVTPYYRPAKGGLKGFYSADTWGPLLFLVPAFVLFELVFIRKGKPIMKILRFFVFSFVWLCLLGIYIFISAGVAMSIYG